MLHNEAIQTAALAQLEQKGLIKQSINGPTLTRRWRAAMARSSLHLLQSKETAEDIRLPIVLSLYTFFGDAVSRQELTMMVALLQELEAHSLGMPGSDTFGLFTSQP